MYLLYPKVLAGRFELDNDINRSAEAAPIPGFAREPNLIHVEEVRQLAMYALRIEALTSPFRYYDLHPSSTPIVSPFGSPQLNGLDENGHMVIKPPKSAKRLPPPHLGPGIDDDMTDEDLLVVIDSLTTRIENSMSTLVCLIHFPISPQFTLALPSLRQYFKVFVS